MLPELMPATVKLTEWVPRVASTHALPAAVVHLHAQQLAGQLGFPWGAELSVAHTTVIMQALDLRYEKRTR